MALSIRDKDTDAAVRRLAALKRKGLTETIREAIENELKREQAGTSLIERIELLHREVDRYPRTGEKADKAFYDSLNDE
jgi:antitoxin VapB